MYFNTKRDVQVIILRPINTNVYYYTIMERPDEIEQTIIPLASSSFTSFSTFHTFTSFLISPLKQ
jgi:hypothetical protein